MNKKRKSGAERFKKIKKINEKEKPFPTKLPSAQKIIEHFNKGVGESIKHKTYTVKGIWQNIYGSDLAQVCATMPNLIQIYWIRATSRCLCIWLCQHTNCWTICIFYSEIPEPFIAFEYKNTLHVTSAYSLEPAKDKAAFYSPRSTTTALMSNPRCFL